MQEWGINMKKYECRNKQSNIITNQWTDENGLDETYYEPCFGLPERWVNSSQLSKEEIASAIDSEIREISPKYSYELQEDEVDHNTGEVLALKGSVKKVEAVNSIFYKLPAEYEIIISEMDNWDKVRSQRNALLSSSDFTQLPDAPFDDNKKSEWTKYRSVLRDIPNSQKDSWNIVWPSMPK